MQVAQFNSHYQYDPKFERGMYLYEGDAANLLI